MTTIKKIFLAIGGIIIFAVTTLWFISPSHAAEVALANAPTVDEWTVLVTPEQGLTQEGCERFFPKLAGTEICLVRWNAQKYPGHKLRLLQKEAHPVALRVFQTSRNHGYRNLIDGIARQEDLSDEAVREMKATTYGPSALDKCLAIGKFGADQCILMTGVLVALTPEELEEFQDPAEKLFIPDAGCSDIACRTAMHQMYGPRIYVNPNPSLLRGAMARPLRELGRQPVSNMRFPAKK